MDSVLRFEIPWKTSTRMRKLWFHFVVALCVHGLGFHPTAGTNAVTAFYIQEGSAVDSVVGSLTITPPFVLVAGTPPSYQNDLKLVQNRIVTKTILNRERVDSYNLTIVKIPATKYEVIVYVLDLNDNSPTFIGGSSKKVELYECNQMQVIKCPSFRRKLMAVDPDFGSNSTQSYTIISGNTNSTFKLVTNRDNNGDLYADLVLNTNKTIDYEVKDVYVLNISASDGGNPARIGYLNLSISVIDINDNEPVFANQTYRASVREDAAVPTSILQVFASDKDAGTNAQVQYSIETYSNTLAIFGIHPTTGVIVNNVALDFEKTRFYDIVVKAEDKGSSLQLSKTAVVNIQVLDVNDNDPQIHVKYSLGGSYQVTEDAIIGTVVVFVSVTDADSGSNGEVNVTLEGGSGYFRMKYNALTRESIISVGKSLDREEQHIFELKAVASDRGNPPRTSRRSFRINVGDVNDNRPKFDRHTYVTRILENATVNTLVANVHATDRDAGSNAELVYSIANTSQSMEYRHWFSINPTSGEITTAASLDREQVSQIELLVVVTDKGQPSLSANCTVVVNLTDYNDNDPYFNQSMYNASVIENSGPGSSVVQLFAKDPDIGENSLIRYSLSSQNIPFLVDAHTGLVTTTRTLDHEQHASYTFQVAATDGGGRRTLANVHVKVVDLNDNSPVFNPTSYNVQHLENIPIGHAVCELTATDKDSGLFSKLNYVIEQGNSDKVFKVNGSGFIVLAKTIDRETKDSYTLTVNAFDGGGRESTNKAVVTVTVLDVNDEPPIFSRSLYNFSVVEHSPALTVIGSVSATSRDDGTNAEITYSVIGGNTDNIIIINGTGTLYLQAEIDHEKTPMLHLRVQAKDKGTPPQYSDVSVTIQVLDLNDNPPVFHVPSPDDVIVMENAAAGTKFYNLNATDRDSDANGRVTYSIIGGDGKGLFLIDPITGWLRTNATFDYEKTSKYSLQIRAVDSGARPLESNITITVNIGDDDEYDPIFQNDNYDFGVPGNAKVGDVIGKVSASDQDGGAAGVVLFVFHNPKSNALIINITSGVITVNRTLNDGSDLEARRRRSIDDYSSIGPEKESSSKRRVRRAADSKDLDYTIRAYSGKLNSKKFAEVSLRVKVDYTCEGCAIPTTGARGTTGITGTALAVIVGLSVLAGVVLLAFVVVLLLIYSHRKKRRTRQNPPLRFDGSFDEITVHPRTTGNANYATVSSDSIPRAYPPDEYSPLRRNTDSNNGTPTTGTDASETPGSSGSASSGRGSSEGDFEESPAVLVNGDIGGFQSDTNMKTFVADSGIQQDDDQISQLTISDGSGILHVDGFNGSESKSDKTDKTDKILARLEFQSVESMHVFGEEGGGEADGGHDVGNLLYAKLAEADADDESIADDPRPFIDEGRDHPSYGGSLSSIIGSQEELTGSYNWDYLLDWGPQFQPLAEVFSEIGRMKDEGGDKKDVIRNGSIPSSSRLRPQLSGIATVDMLSSMSSLPHSPVSPPSTQYTSPAFSPNFTPAITPLITRSPSVSPLDTGTVSPAYTSRGVTPRSSRPASTHIIRLRQDDDTNSELSHSPSISDNESNLEIDV